MPLPAGQNTPRSSQLVTSPAAVAWSDGTLFDGFLWIGIALPTAGHAPTSPAWASPFLMACARLQRLPKFIKVPIINGAIDQTTQIFYNQDINPPGNQYVAYWYTTDGTLITPNSGAAVAFTVTTPQTTITVPTLTVPSSPSNPVPQV